MGAPSTGCSGRFWNSPPCFSCPWGARRLFPLAFKPAFLQLPPRCRKPEVTCRKARGELTIWGQREGKESTLLCLCNPYPLSKWKKKKGKEKVEREARGEDVFLPPHYSACCKLPVAASLAPALLSPLASAPKFLTTFFPAGNVNQDTFRFKKKKKEKSE